MIDELLPCPFCGGNAALYSKQLQNGDHIMNVRCEVCKASTRMFGCENNNYDDENYWNQLAAKKAINIWNLRSEKEQCKNDSRIEMLS